MCAFGFGVDGLGLVGRSVRWKVWGWWVERHWGWELVGRGWSLVVGAGRGGVRGLGLVGRGLCGWVWGWWVGVGRSWFILEGRCFEVGRSMRLRVWGWWVEVHLGVELVGRDGS